jgi:hypothetical protein
MPRTYEQSKYRKLDIENKSQAEMILTVQQFLPTFIVVWMAVNFLHGEVKAVLMRWSPFG